MVLASPAWAEQLERDVLPWIQGAGDLGKRILEIGPGPGLSTDLFRMRVPHVTAVEVDPGLAAQLGARLAEQIGVVDTTIDETDYHFRFITRKPVSAELRAR